MQIKEVTIRKARRSTVKSTNGNYDMNEADISLTVEAEEGQLNTQEIIDRVKALVEETIKNATDDPAWINEPVVNETPKEVKHG